MSNYKLTIGERHDKKNIESLHLTQKVSCFNFDVEIVLIDYF